MQIAGNIAESIFSAKQLFLAQDIVKKLKMIKEIIAKVLKLT